MSRDASITLPLGGEDRLFRFGLGEHVRLQDKLDMGVSWIVQNLHPYASATRAGLSLGDVLAAKLLGDIRKEQTGELLLQGLIGGGMSPNDAAKVIQAWVYDRPVLEPVLTAYGVGVAVLIGAGDEDAAGEDQGEGDQLSPEGNSASGKTATTRSARQRGSRPKK